jgi:hypothetical protein
VYLGGACATSVTLRLKSNRRKPPARKFYCMRFCAGVISPRCVTASGLPALLDFPALISFRTHKYLGRRFLESRQHDLFGTERAA